METLEARLTHAISDWSDLDFLPNLPAGTLIHVYSLSDVGWIAKLPEGECSFELEPDEFEVIRCL